MSSDPFNYCSGEMQKLVCSELERSNCMYPGQSQVGSCVNHLCACLWPHQHTLAPWAGLQAFLQALSPFARAAGAAHPQVVALEAQMRLRTSPGTPLPLMFKLHPSGALRGYESGERSPFCLGPWSHGAVQHPCSNYTPGRPETPGEVSNPQNLSAFMDISLNNWLEEEWPQGARGLSLVFILRGYPQS